MQTQLPSRERRVDTPPYEGIRRRAPSPLVSLGVAAAIPATLFVLSALRHSPTAVVAALSVVVGAATALRFGPS